jgi:hypothetical protein
MHRRTVLAQGYRPVPTARRAVRGVKISPNGVRSNVAAATPPHSTRAIPSSTPIGFQLDPYLDYGRFLTARGGVLIIYKDLDERLRHTLWRVFAWTTFTMIDGVFLHERLPLQRPWIKVAYLIAAAILNWLVVRPPVEIYRNIEIRPDCMIIEGHEVFWAKFMEHWPSFRPGKDGRRVLSGIYGTRFVEFLTVRRFDDHDRMPETFAVHLQAAMKQLWTGLH